MKEKPPLLGLCRHCEKHKRDFEECVVLVEPDEVITNCRDFQVLDDEQLDDYSAGANRAT